MDDCIKTNLHTEHDSLFVLCNKIQGYMSQFLKESITFVA